MLANSGQALCGLRIALLGLWLMASFLSCGGDFKSLKRAGYEAKREGRLEDAATKLEAAVAELESSRVRWWFVSDLGSSYGTLGLVYEEQRDYDRAKDAYVRAISALKEWDGSDGFSIAHVKAKEDLARITLLLGECEKGRALYEKTLEAARSLDPDKWILDVSQFEKRYRDALNSTGCVDDAGRPIKG